MNRYSVPVINWLLIFLVLILFAACATTSTPVEPPIEPVSFSDSAKPLIHAKLGEVQIMPFGREVVKDDWLYSAEGSYYRKDVEIKLKNKFRSFLSSNGLFGASNMYFIDVKATPLIFKEIAASPFVTQIELTVKYEFRSGDGTLLVSENITSQGSKGPGSRSGAEESITTAVSANIAKLSIVVNERLSISWLSYTKRQNNELKKISNNLKKENRYFRVISSNALVRNMPDANARDVAILSQADLIHVTGSLPSGWFQVSKEGKPVGWVHSTLVREDFASAPSYRPVEAPKTSLSTTPPPTVPIDVASMTLDFGSYHALVVGNNDYQYLPKLNTAINDAQSMARVLQNSYGFNVRFLRNGTRADILRSINGYRRTLTNRDNLLIFYAGHGWLDKEADQGYWLPVDAEKQDSTNWISNSSITDALRALEAKHVLIIADSCYSGKLARGVNIRIRTKNYYKKICEKKARTVMASGGLEPVADEGGKGDHSVFASALIEALNENQGVLDATLLFSQIRRPVMVNADQTPEYSDIRKAGHDGGDFLFVKQKMNKAK